MRKFDPVDKAEFAKLVEAVGGRERAATVMAVGVGTVANALTDEPERFLGLRALLELKRAAGVLKPVQPSDAGNGTGGTIFMGVNQLRELAAVRVSEFEDGFQRDLNLNQVAEIEALIRSGFTKFPPIVVGMVPNGQHLLIDGQHRRAAHVNAGIGCHAHVVEVKDLDEARALYLVWNGRSRKPTLKEAYEASRNPVSTTLKAFAENHGLSFEQVCGLFRGLVGRGVDFVEPTATIDRDAFARAEVIVGIWTADSRWASERSALFNSPGLLRALGHFARPFSPENLESALLVIRDRRDGFRSDSAWAKTLRRGARPLATSLMTYVAPRLHGGISGRSANRVRAG